MSLTKSTGNYINPLDPIYDLAYDPKGGSGILKAIIWIGDGSFSVERYLPFQWSETVNGLELEIEKPIIICGYNVEEDIINSLIYEKIKFDTISFITK
jgi:hypothetical protein